MRRLENVTEEQKRICTYVYSMRTGRYAERFPGVVMRHCGWKCPLPPSHPSEDRRAVVGAVRHGGWSGFSAVANAENAKSFERNREFRVVYAETLLDAYISLYRDHIYAHVYNNYNNT